jgi:hypothetical protein
MASNLKPVLLEIDAQGSFSVVAEGPYEGRSLHQLAHEHHTELFSPAAPTNSSFPFFVNVFDIPEPERNSIPPVLATTPCAVVVEQSWYVITAQPGSAIDISPHTTPSVSTPSDTRRCPRRQSGQRGAFYHLPPRTGWTARGGLVLATVRATNSKTKTPGSLAAARSLTPMYGTGRRSLVSTQDYWIVEHRQQGGIDLLPEPELRLVLITHGTAELKWHNDRLPMPPLSAALIPAASAATTELVATETVSLLEIGCGLHAEPGLRNRPRNSITTNGL